MLLLFVGCATTVVVGTPPSADDSGSGDPDTTDLEHLLDDTGADVPPDDTGSPDTGSGDTGPAEPTQDALFGLDAIHTFALTIASSDLRSLGGSPYTYVPADLEVDGARFPNIGVRIKGRLGSLRYLPSKSGLKLDFLEYGETDKLDGLEKVNLNNMVQDCAKVHELASYSIHRSIGVPAPRVGYAQVTINAEDYGLYSLVEDYEDTFLQANFAEASGNLYDGDYYLWPDGNYTLIDFTASAQQYFSLDEGTDVSQSDLRAITQAIAASSASTWAANVGAVVDLDQHAAFVAAQAWTGQYDGYSYYSNNYRVYLDPARGGKAVFMPWDPDWAFYASTNVTSFYGTLSAGCYADPACRAAMRGYADQLAANVPGSAIQAEVEAAAALIHDALRDDPKLESSVRDIQACQADLLSWFSRRGAELEGWAR